MKRIEFLIQYNLDESPGSYTAWENKEKPSTKISHIVSFHLCNIFWDAKILEMERWISDCQKFGMEHEEKGGCGDKSAASGSILTVVMNAHAYTHTGLVNCIHVNILIVMLPPGDTGQSVQGSSLYYFIKPCVSLHSSHIKISIENDIERFLSFYLFDQQMKNSMHVHL